MDPISVAGSSGSPNLNALTRSNIRDLRYVFENPPVWGDLLTVLSNIWLMFIALSLTARDNEHIALNLIYEKLPENMALYIRQFWKLMIIIVGLVLIVYGIELVEGMRGKYWEMWYFEFTENGIEFEENYMPKKICCHDPSPSWVSDLCWCRNLPDQKDLNTL